MIFIGAVFSSFAQNHRRMHDVSTIAAPPKLDTIHYYVPDFYSANNKYARDTVFVFKCYDKHDSLIKYVEDFEQVRYYSLFKEYIDSTHTYKDNKGVRQFLPVSFIVSRYDKVGKDRWMCIQYPGNKYTELKVDRKEIVEDMMVFIDTSGDSQADLVKYYHFLRTTVVGR